ncbi:MAG: alpha/beta hydrolase family protein, partial [Blastocatellia bacterium]
MKQVGKTFWLFFVIASLALAAFAQSKRPIAFDDLISMKRVADAQISPDGKWVAYVVNVVDKQANRGKRSVWVVPISGGAAKQLITSSRNDDTPRWSADGKWIAFLSSRDGTPQIFVAAADGSGQRKVTDVPLGVADFTWSPDGKMLAFSTEVYPECADLKCTAQKAEAADASKVKAVIADRLLYRHWSEFKLGKRSHVFVVSVESGEPKDLTPGDFDSPPFSLGDPLAYDFSPDGKELCFSRNTDKVEATSTNNDLFIVSVSGGEAKRITGTNTGYDSTPRYSPDGKWIAYRSQERPGYEADRFKLMLYNRQSGAVKELTAGFDRNIGEMLWTPDSQSLIIGAEDEGRELIGVVSINGGGVKPLITKTASAGISLSADGKTLAFTRSSLTMPAEVFAAFLKEGADGGNTRQLTTTNAALLAQLDLNPAEDFW